MNVFDAFVHKYSRLPTETDPDYLEMLRMTKYRIMDVPDFSPGKCANCGSSKNDGRKYIDFGLQVDWYGTVYLCGTCIHDISSNMGLFEKIEEELHDLRQQASEIEELHHKGEKLHEFVVKTYDEFEEFYGNLSARRESDLESNSDESTSVGTDETASEPTPNITKPRTAKQNTSRRSENVRSLADLLNDG